jgi:hypothetical protein
MSKAHELLTRITAELTERGFQMNEWNDGRIMSTMIPRIEYVNGTRFINVEETYRSNGTEENVTATISVSIADGIHSTRIVFKVKVPKDASDKVINNRIDKTIAEFNK